MIWMALWWVIGIALVVALLWLLLSRVGGLGVGPPPADPPETLLRRRYAAGEIDTDEFQRRLSELRKSKEAR